MSEKTLDSAPPAMPADWPHPMPDPRAHQRLCYTSVFLNCYMNDAATGVTQLLEQWSNGDRNALDHLTPLLYKELRGLAGRYLRHERPDHTLQSTALVHEAYLRLVDQKNVRWKNRAHFFDVSAQLIRRILVDHARKHQAVKRGAGGLKLSLDDAVETPGQGRDLDLVGLDDALETLANIDAQQSRIVELRFFTGLSIEETAEVLGTSPATVKRDWAMAKAWLFREISGRPRLDG